jgi:hypothetical protein
MGVVASYLPEGWGATLKRVDISSPPDLCLSKYKNLEWPLLR